jgi:hypothetical protein
MRDREIFFLDIRVLLSGSSALLSSLLYHNLGHFTIIPSQPATWHAATEHRCGWVLIASSAWFVFEATNRLWKRFSDNDSSIPYYESIEHYRVRDPED